jgi:hypothetical protein
MRKTLLRGFAHLDLIVRRFSITFSNDGFSVTVARLSERHENPADLENPVIMSCWLPSRH